MCLCFPRDWTKSLYCDPFEDYNIFAYATKCSVFGETALSGSGVAAAALLVCAFILITGALTAMVYVLARGRSERTTLFFWVMAAVMATSGWTVPVFQCQISLRLHHGFPVSRARGAAWGRVSGRRGPAALAFQKRGPSISGGGALLRGISVLCQRRLFIPYAFLNGRGTVHALSRDRSAESAGTP